jgi:hypothetical protein
MGLAHSSGSSDTLAPRSEIMLSLMVVTRTWIRCTRNHSFDGLETVAIASGAGIDLETTSALTAQVFGSIPWNETSRC